MAKTLLTAKQLAFLELIQKQPQLTKRFYLTGGTALTEFYLKHRLSEDIDLFTEKEEVDQKLIEVFLKKETPKLGVKEIKRSQFLGLFNFFLIYKDGQTLKVDFNYYPFPRIAKGINFNGLQIDSLEDIAVNKIQTVFIKPRARDYIDLFFIMKRSNFSNLNKLILEAKAKFDWHIDKIDLVNQFLKVKDITPTEIPKMLVKFSQTKVENFFLQLAKSLKNDIFK
ncbi:MAG: nucleotidyl transferase AbiEii/AbiGii toxin family protein [Candidatus Beckwithbacteria bacterium]